jgi:integrase
MKLTKRAIDAMTYEGQDGTRDVRWDTLVPGFGIRVYPTGKKAFVLSYRTHGRKRMMTLGTFGVLTLDQARTAARKHLVEVEIQDVDPLEERRKESQGETLGELCTKYLEEHAKAHKKSWRDDERRIEKHLRPAWGKLKAKSIKRADVSALHLKIGGAAPYEANRTVALVSKIYELAERWGFVPEGHPNPARGIDKFREEKRDRWITPEEVPRLMQAIGEEPNTKARLAFLLYLLTGVRKSELLTCRWKDIDFNRAELRLGDTKAGRIHYVPLSPPAIKLLEMAPREADNPYVLPGNDPDKHLVNIDKAWNRVRKAANVTDVRLHDLIGKVLNHSNTSTTAIYARFGQDQAREALDRHAERLQEVAGMEIGINQKSETRPDST